jgi:hypothetical protein
MAVSWSQPVDRRRMVTAAPCSSRSIRSAAHLAPTTPSTCVTQLPADAPVTLDAELARSVEGIVATAIDALRSHSPTDEFRGLVVSEQPHGKWQP